MAPDSSDGRAPDYKVRGPVFNSLSGMSLFFSSHHIWCRANPLNKLTSISLFSGNTIRRIYTLTHFIYL